MTTVFCALLALAVPYVVLIVGTNLAEMRREARRARTFRAR